MNIKLNLKKLVSLRGVALVLVASGIVTSLTGCGKKAECNISGNHAHLYQNEQGYIRYIDKEYLSYEGYQRQEDYVSIEGEEDYYKFLNKKDLLRIDDNLDLILAEQERNQDYMEYRYSYIYLQPIPHTRKIGKVTSTYFTYIPVTRHSWTKDANHSRLTGETRVCHYVYVAYKVEVNEKGKYVLIPSSQVDDITIIMDEYPFIKKTFHKVVTLDGVEADYEDGPEDELSLEDKERATEYEADQTASYFYEDEPKVLEKTI